MEPTVSQGNLRLFYILLYPFAASFRLLPSAFVELSAAIRADVLLVVSVRGGVDFETTFETPFHLSADAGGLHPVETGLRILIDLTLWFQGCVSVVFDEIRVGVEWGILEG